MKEQLEIAALLIGVTAPVLGGLWFLWKHRQSSIQNNYQALARNWMNEGDFYNREPMYILMALLLTKGELIGSITLSGSGQKYYVNVTPGGFTQR